MERKRVQRSQPDWCEYDGCVTRPLWSVQHEEYSDHIPPEFVCGRHLSQTCLSKEYGEGDTLLVERVRFDF